MYIPKNKILTNQYTSGGEYVIKTTGDRYVGFYHKLFTGQFFTGKTPNDSNILELALDEQSQTPEIPQELSTTNVIALFLNDPDPLVDTDVWNQKDIITYLRVTGQDTKNDQPKETPLVSYPLPTDQDYKLGVFTRYFLVKVNEPLFMEVNEKTYNKIQSQDKNWAFELYTPFSFPWTLVGSEAYVEKTNRNIVLLTEQRIKRKGLQQYLRHNYLKFFKPNLEAYS